MKKKKIYLAPAVQVKEVAVENGFEISVSVSASTSAFQTEPVQDGLNLIL